MSRRRTRGFLAGWNPQPATLERLEQVGAIFSEYHEYLPLTVRQVFYRLVGAHGLEKSTRSYNNLVELLIKARRARLIPFENLRDDGTLSLAPFTYEDVDDFHAETVARARIYRLDRQVGQEHYLEVWCEAAGMAGQLAAVAHEYGVPVYSGGGFNSLTEKWEAAQRMDARGHVTIVLHVGDYDRAGRDIFTAVSEDVRAFLADAAPPIFERVAVTPEQIERFELPPAPDSGAVQAEAFSPDQLAAEVREAIIARIDHDGLVAAMGEEERQRADVLRRLGGLLKARRAARPS